MKIAMIGQKGIPTLYGGIERHVEELSARLAKLKHEVFVYTRPYYTPKNLKVYKGVKLISLPSIRTKHLDAITHTLFSTIHALFKDYDVIHYQGVGPSLLSFIPRIFKRKVKVVTTFHCRDSVLSKWGSFAKFSLNLGEWAATKFAHETITVSKTLQKYIQDTYNKKVEYIPSGVNTVQKVGAVMITREFGLMPDGYFLAVARLIEDKGLHFLVEAYLKMKTDKKLVIVGDASFTSEYVRKLKKAAGENPNIIFTGWQAGEMLHELYSNAFAFVHPSISEGLPVAVLEAASYGLGVIASDISANLEVCADLGIIFKNADASSILEKLNYVQKNPEVIKNLGEKIRALVLEKYNWENIASLTQNIYQKEKSPIGFAERQTKAQEA